MISQSKVIRYCKLQSEGRNRNPYSMKCVIMSNRNIFISNLDKLTDHLICWVEKILNAAARIIYFYGYFLYSSREVLGGGGQKEKNLGS